MTVVHLKPGAFPRDPRATSLQRDELRRAISTFGEHLPIVFFAAPRVYVAASSRTVDLKPAVRRPQLLWSADTLAVQELAPRKITK